MESYIVKKKKEAYVWADNGKGKLEKRKVELGKYDEELGEYKIKSGLKKMTISHGRWMACMKV